ncbi:MAG: AI-2E family transporter [Phycisphaerales bacterium]
MVKEQKSIEQIAGITIIIAILVGCFVILKPFTIAILWAAILCFATWPLYELILKWVKGRRNLAAFTMTLIILLVLFVPFFIFGLTFTNSIENAMDWLNSQNLQTLSQPPAWVSKIPLVGSRISELWTRLSTNAEPAIRWLVPWVQKAGVWLLSHSIGFAQGIFQLAISILVAFFFYRDGKEIALRIKEGFIKIHGQTAEHLINVTKATVQSVVYGIIATAIFQSVATGIGLAIAKVPSPILLAFLTFFLSFIPAGAAPVWVGASIWLLLQGHIGWGIFMFIYGATVISSIDNFVRSFMMSRKSRLPFIVMFIGVLGGIGAFGLIGIFIGPTLLIVGLTLAKEILTQQPVITTTTLENEKPPEEKTIIKTD